MTNVVRWTCSLSIEVQYSAIRYKIDHGNMSYDISWKKLQ